MSESNGSRALTACGIPGEPCPVVEREVPPRLRAADVAERLGFHRQARSLRRQAERIVFVHRAEARSANRERRDDRHG